MTPSRGRMHFLLGWEQAHLLQTLSFLATSINVIKNWSQKSMAGQKRFCHLMVRTSRIKVDPYVQSFALDMLDRCLLSPQIRLALPQAILPMAGAGADGRVTLWWLGLTAASVHSHGEPMSGSKSSCCKQSRQVSLQKGKRSKWSKWRRLGQKLLEVMEKAARSLWCLEFRPWDCTYYTTLV